MTRPNGDGTSAPMDPRALARRAGLVYVEEQDPGIRRRVCGKGFTYLDREGATVRDDTIRDRIDALAIPPAWEDVWICARPDGHIQATGRDSEGRKQYRYHARWRDASDRIKFRRLAEFGGRLPALRRRVGRDLAGDSIDAGRVGAAALRLLDRTAMRVGNESYAEENGSFGVATLLRNHVRVGRKGRLRVAFTAKGGRERSLELRDVALARAIRELLRLEGDPLLRHRTEGTDPVPLGAEGVNAYLRAASGRNVTAKTFRTWAGTLAAFRVLLDFSAAAGGGRGEAQHGPAADGDGSERTGTGEDPVLAAVDRAAEILGNTRATAREFYVHPGLLRAHDAGDLPDLIRRAREELDPTRSPGFRADEPLLVGLLPRLDPYLDED